MLHFACNQFSIKDFYRNTEEINHIWKELLTRCDVNVTLYLKY